MAKKNTPENKNRPGSDASDSGKKRRGFISDFDMWDMNLDISGDETIDPMVRTGEFPKQSGTKPATQPVESRAKTIPIQPRKPQQPVAKRNTSDKGSAIANRTQQKPSSHTAGVKAKSQIKSNNVRPTTQIKPPAQNSARQSMSRTQPVAPARNAQQGQAVKGGNAQARVRAASTASQSQRGEAAVFTTRDVNHRIIPQDINRVEELKKKRQRERILKSVSWLWVIARSMGKGIVTLSKFVGRMMPVLYRHKAVVGAAFISFAVGIYFGGFGSKSNVTATVGNDIAANKTTHAAIHTAKTTVKHRHMQKRVAKKHEPAAPVKQTVPAATSDHDSLAQSTVTHENGSSEQTLADNQFSGKDIPLEGDVASKLQGASVTNQSNTAEMAASSPESAQAAVQQTPTMANSAKFDTAAFNHLLKLNVDFFNQKKWQQVVDTSNQILALKPFTEAALINRSAAYTEIGQYALAVEDANTLISINKGNGVAYNNRAYAYEKAGNIKYAVIDYKKACDLGIQQSCNDMQRLAKGLSDSQ